MRLLVNTLLLFMYMQSAELATLEAIASRSKAGTV